MPIKIMRTSDSLMIKQTKVYGADLDKIYAYATNELFRILNKKSSEIIYLACKNKEKDGFKISFDGEAITIFGSNPRSMLFGVYSFLKHFAGCRWFHPGEEIIKEPSETKILSKGWELKESPSFSRRYIFPEEHFFTFSLLKDFIEWAPRNMIGDITLSFSAWKKWREKIIPEIQKRDMSVTLSGHCLKMFVPQSGFAKHPDWFAIHDNKRIDSGQYCYSNSLFQKYLAEQLIQFLSQSSNIKRLSIWAEDNALICQCDKCRKKGFLKSFVECIDQVAKLVRKKYPSVEVDFLAYNAGLEWGMIEPSSGLQPKHCGMELAYWGRDYRYQLGKSRVNADRRAVECIKKWRNSIGGPISLLEYYTDIWLFTHLIPPLPHRIASDCKHYEKLGIDAIGSLVCLAPPEIYQKKLLRDEYAYMTFPNLYFFTVSSWNSKRNMNEVIEDYAEYLFGRDIKICLKYLLELEKLMVRIASYNQKLFRLRFVDVWHRDTRQAEGGIKFRPQEWTPKIQWNHNEKQRFADCKKLVAEMEIFQKDCKFTITECDFYCCERSKSLRQRWEMVFARLNAILMQLQTQQAIYNDDIHTAKKNLKKLLKLPKGLLVTEKNICKKWVRKFTKN